MRTGASGRARSRAAAQAIAFWSLLLLLLPLLLLQAAWTAVRTPRLPEARGPRRAQLCSPGTGKGARAGDAAQPFGLLIVGESTAVGVGADTLDDALAGCLARTLAERLGRPVSWSVIGRNGARMADVDRLLASEPAIPGATLAIVPMGVNDTVKLSSLHAWRAALERVRSRLLSAGIERIAFASVPPVGWFTALPRPLRWLLGWRSRQLDRALLEWAACSGGTASYLPIRFPPLPELLAGDGYHPGPEGYRRWASMLADQLEASGLLIARD
jgi:hypothetical protein